MQTNSANLEGLLVVQLSTRVGSNGTMIGDQRTSTMPANPRTLNKESTRKDSVKTILLTNMISNTKIQFIKLVN